MRPLSLLMLAALALSQAREAAPPPMDLKDITEAIRGFDGTVGVAARDLRTGAEIAINADARFPTASAIKTAVMIEAYHQAAEGTAALDAALVLRDADKVGGSGVLKGMSEGLSLRIRDLVYLMIVLSDNTATNLLVQRLGTANIEKRLLGYGLRDTKIFRPTFRDGRPDIHPELEREFGLGMATPREMAKVMALIAQGEAVDARASGAMLATLQAQQDRAMIPRHLPSGLQIGNKTGTDSEKQPDERGRRGAIRTDAAIVQGDGLHYVVAIFVRRGEDGRGTADNAGVLLGARISRLVYELFAGAKGRSGQ